MLIKLPVAVYAELDGEWSEVLHIDSETAIVTLERKGAPVKLTALDVLKRNLLWPDGRGYITVPGMTIIT